MRKKETRLIVTFHITADAMAAESVCLRRRVPGRLIPVPRTLSASCGLAFSAPPDAAESVRAALEEEGIVPEGYFEKEVLV